MGHGAVILEDVEIQPLDVQSDVPFAVEQRVMQSLDFLLVERKIRRRSVFVAVYVTDCSTTDDVTGFEVAQVRMPSFHAFADFSTLEINGHRNMYYWYRHTHEFMNGK